MIRQVSAAGATFVEDSYRQLLAELAPRRVYLCPCPGNAGDELIVLGTMELLSSLGIERTFSGSRADLLLYPGGNPTMWPLVLDTWRAIWRRLPGVPFVVGPSTFQSRDTRWVDELAGSGTSVVALVARDPVSFEALRSVRALSSARKLLAHDAALYLRGTPLLRSWLDGVRQDHDLCAFRSDHEARPSSVVRALGALERAIPAGGRLTHFARSRATRARIRTIERRVAGSVPLWIGDAADQRFNVFLDAVMRARHVHTDRLHVAICGALLNKTIFAYPTAYAKLEAVVEHSMKDWADVRFADERCR